MKKIKSILVYLIFILSFLLLIEMINPGSIKELPRELYKEFATLTGIIILALFVLIALYEYFDK